MRTTLSLALAPLLLASLALPRLRSWPGGQADDLDSARLEHLVTAIGTALEENYIFADVGAKLAQHLKQRLWDGAYEGLSLEALAARISADLKSVNGDKHLNAFPIPQDRGSRPAPSPEERERARIEEGHRSNHGFRKLEILDGNVGYLELNGFASAEVAGETAVAAMGFFANVDALVIDLRGNGGGDPSMLQLLCSYFLAERTLLNSFERRGVAQLEEYWTLPHVPGKKLVDVPIWVLTSGRTFSCAEEFSYDLKNLKRATLVGERTGGGANPGGVQEIDGLIGVFIPDGRAVNPITKTNWEGVGVEPDVAVPAAQALDTALRAARAASAAKKGG
jgi:retinol-binding protein 3